MGDMFPSPNGFGSSEQKPDGLRNQNEYFHAFFDNM